jgi:hypothetical protein
MTEKRIAAHQANGALSPGPVTAPGRARIRAANLRHGFYSPAEAVALTRLGNDPAEIETLRQDVHGEKESPRTLRKELADHGVEVIRRWKRAGRRREGYAQRLAIRKESLAGPSPSARAAEIALVQPQTALMQWMEESSFRQICRITTLRLKIERAARDERFRETPPGTRDVYEKIAT